MKNLNLLNMKNKNISFLVFYVLEIESKSGSIQMDTRKWIQIVRVRRYRYGAKLSLSNVVFWN